MAELENPLLNEFCAADTGVAAVQSSQGPAPKADQCLKQSLNGCKRFNRNRIADNGIQKSSDPKQVARSAKIPELTTNTLMSSKGSMKLPSGFVEQKQFKANTSLCRFMRFDTATEARKGTQLSLGLPTSRNPVVVATYNDLLLCCTSKDYQRNYYICNAYTMQWVGLPPTPSRCHKRVRVGFICNVPDYKCEEDNWKGNNSQLNVECRSTVVRILPPVEYANDEKKCDTFKLNVEIFSSETGEWKESVVSSPRDFDFHGLNEFSFAYNGMLYWPTDRGLSVIGLGPFYDNDGTSSSSSNGDGNIDHKLGFTIFEEPLDGGFSVQYLGVCGGYVRMCNMSMMPGRLYVYELKDSQDRDAAGKKLCLSERRVYSLDPKMFPNQPCCIQNAFDPNNKDILYLRVSADVIKWNIHTGEWSKIVKNCGTNRFYYTVVLPLWPTPVPRLA
ncbi:uncharacterized protein Pyn_20638 [Prunus yedoensis var. nudiflora]|uniref:F-box protein At3g26010-like beta-propeller domain-containing protein n=1 Tax=Prunus yedoensis var. nudiflora TaxID=2094558 RepID=A0A314UVE0_PRUYE|nr:uncharacterized protein Pyn_20638 [Prunus yedoensis var. nudiflora]